MPSGRAGGRSSSVAELYGFNTPTIGPEHLSLIANGSAPPGRADFDRPDEVDSIVAWPRRRFIPARCSFKWRASLTAVSAALFCSHTSVLRGRLTPRRSTMFCHINVKPPTSQPTASRRKQLASESNHGFGKAATSFAPIFQPEETKMSLRPIRAVSPLRRKKINQAKPTLTAQYARKLLVYDAETGVLTWRVKASNRVNKGDRAGCMR